METVMATNGSDAAGATASFALTSFFCIFYIGFFVLLIAGFVLWLWMLIDVLKREDSDFKSENDKLLWVLIILLGGWIGGLVYYFMQYRKNRKSAK